MKDFEDFVLLDYLQSKGIRFIVSEDEGGKYLTFETGNTSIPVELVDLIEQNRELISWQLSQESTKTIH